MKRITDIVMVQGETVTNKPHPNPDRIIGEILEELHNKGHHDIRYVGWRRGHGYRFEYDTEYAGTLQEQYDNPAHTDPAGNE